jgi:hypothetical protein
VFAVGALTMLAWLVVAWRMQELPLPQQRKPQPAG